jgi:hypothetical protein
VRTGIEVELGLRTGIEAGHGVRTGTRLAVEWGITPASGREHQPLGTEALVVWAILCFILRRVWGVRSPKHATALSVSSTGGVRSEMP